VSLEALSILILQSSLPFALSHRPYRASPRSSFLCFSPQIQRFLPLVISQLACRTNSDTYAPAVRSTTYTPKNVLKPNIGRRKGIPALKPVLAQPASTDPSFLCPLLLSPTRHSCSSESALERRIFAVQACQIQSLFYFTVQAEKQTGLSRAQEVIHPLDGRVYAWHI
jgi:hypothetical protein